MSKYFPEKYLTKIFTRIQLTRGDKIENVNEIFTDSQLKEINEKKILKILNKPLIFNNKDCKLKLEIKNIENLRIRIFEINTENFLKNSKNKSYAEISLECLIPSS